LAIVAFFVLAARRGRYRLALGSTGYLLPQTTRRVVHARVRLARIVFGIGVGETWKQSAEFPTL
jgi:hypothetical protein